MERLGVRVRSSPFAIALAIVAAMAASPNQRADAQAASPEQRLAADSVWRTAVLDLRLRQEPLERDYRLIGLLLDEAQRWAPTDANIARERVQAWYQASELDRVIEASKDILRNDPGDTVAQLRLITTQISRQQTVGQRLGLYERFLGPAGASIHPAVRSRLALDAALLMREQGDWVGFIDHLTMSAGLDSTNKDAAALAETVFATESSDPVGRLELLSNLLYADPLDPSVHQSMAVLLGHIGAYSQARRFYTSAVLLMYANGQSPPTSVGIDQLVLRWHEEGPASVVKELNTAILSQRDVARRTIMQLDQQGIPSTGVTPPAELRLPIPLEQVRLLAADATGDLETRRASALDMAASVDKLVTTATAQGSAGLIGLDYAMEAVANAITEMLVVTSITGEQGEQLVNSMQRFLGRDDIDVEYREQLTPWAELRSGSAQSARDKFLSLEDSTTTRLGVAITESLLGNEEESRRLLGEVAVDGRLSVIGAWSRSRLMGPEGVWGDETDATAVAGRAVALEIPRWVDQMVSEPRSYLSLAADIIPSGRTASLRLVIRNLSPLPLAVGPDRPINSRFLLTPKLDVGLRASSREVLPEVISADRRLRLAQGEAVEIIMKPEIGYAGWLAETQCLQATRLRWGVLQGFMAGANTTYVPGPMCLETQTEQMVRPPVRPVAPIEDLVHWFESMGGPDGVDIEDVASATARLRAAAVLPVAEGGLGAEGVARLAEAAATRYAALPSASRVVLIANAPHARQNPAMQPLDDAIDGESDVRVLGIAMLARAVSPESPLLAAARASGDSSLGEIADLLTQRFVESDPTYGAVGPDLRAMAGPGLAATSAPVPAQAPRPGP